MARAVRAEAGYAALFLVADKNEWPCRFGWTRDHAKRRSSLQPGNPNQLLMHAVYWVPGVEVAKRIDAELRKAFVGRNIFHNQQFYDLSVDQWIGAVEQIAHNMNVKLYSDEAQMRNLEQAITLALERKSVTPEPVQVSGNVIPIKALPNGASGRQRRMSGK